MIIQLLCSLLFQWCGWSVAHDFFPSGQKLKTRIGHPLAIGGALEMCLWTGRRGRRREAPGDWGDLADSLKDPFSPEHPRPQPPPPPGDAHFMGEARQPVSLQPVSLQLVTWHGRQISSLSSGPMLSSALSPDSLSMLTCPSGHLVDPLPRSGPGFSCANLFPTLAQCRVFTLMTKHTDSEKH